MTSCSVKEFPKRGDILDLAADLGIVNKSGAWYAYNNAKIGQGRENAKKYLKENPAVCAEIEKKVREHYGLAVEEGTEEPKAEPAQETLHLESEEED